jgi:adenylate kinase family enzyme
MKRIVIIGTSGSGKTTLGKALASKLNIEHKDIDSFNWQKGWKALSHDELRSAMSKYTDQEKWITDGNYSSIKDIVWARATHIIWLDYKLPLVLKRFFIRSIKRSLLKEELWNGNIETLRNSIFSRDSLFFWILKTHPKHKKEYSELQESHEFGEKLTRLTSPKKCEEFLKNIMASNSTD